jgi:Xaa-Pro aminopeptidase
MKLTQFRNAIEHHQADYFLINAQPMLRYVSSFTGTEGLVLIFNDKVVGFFDTRYALQVQKECQFDELYLFEDKTMVLGEAAKYCDCLRGCFDANTTSMLQSKSYEALFKDIQYVDTSDFRIKKSDQEIAIIKEGIALADKILEETKPLIQVGMSENEVVGLLFQTMIHYNIKHFSFNTIVASGLRSAFPHGVASSKIIETNDIVTIDFGIMYEGYCTDMTRTFFMGNKDETLEKIYNIVLEANELAIKACKPGISGEAIDQVARQYIISKGYGAHFIHGTGHGLGMDIHEAPYVRAGAKTLMEPGMIITIEPGIYVEGLGGVRIEDVVLITHNGAEVLTKSPKHLK